MKSIAVLHLKHLYASISDRIERKETLPVNRYEGFKENGAAVLRDRRGTVKAEIPVQRTGKRRLPQRRSVRDL